MVTAIGYGMIRVVNDLAPGKQREWLCAVTSNAKSLIVHYMHLAVVMHPIASYSTTADALAMMPSESLATTRSFCHNPLLSPHPSVSSVKFCLPSQWIRRSEPERRSRKPTSRIQCPDHIRQGRVRLDNYSTTLGKPHYKRFTLTPE
jgi:hypothetical protein